MHMTREEITSYFGEIKRRLENERDLLVLTPPDVALALVRDEDQLLPMRLDRQALQRMPYPAPFVEKAVTLLDDGVTMNRRGDFRYTLLIVLDKECDLTSLACVAWDDSKEVAMTVFHEDDLIVLNAHL